MGFYGNIVNSNKAAFTFDAVYSSRYDMDRNCNSDDVFLGRYVLVEYDNPPVKVYARQESGRVILYVDSHYTNKVTVTKNALYQDIISGTFFRWDNDKGIWTSEGVSEPYKHNYNTDVTYYGRGYDSTAWLKRYDVSSGQYSYVMVAELNTVTPEFHLLIEPPSESARVPYFDLESTNIDYYLHLTGNYHDTMKKASNANLSDEKVDRRVDQWSYETGTNKEIYTPKAEVGVQADIFYNKSGFDVNTRTFVPEETMRDSINFTKSASGRRYSGGIFDQHSPDNVADDTREWYIHLPSIGNAVCQMWDKMYGESRNQTLSQSREDSKALYDHDTTIGIINSVRDLLGYTFKPLKNDTPNNISKEDINLYYSTATGSSVPQEYYYYAYSPEFTSDSSGDYYLENGEYKLANKVVTPAASRYAKKDRWVLTKLNAPSEDSLYGLIFTLHKLIGTGDVDSRSLDTIHGCMNRIKDIIDNIDTQLVPNRIVWTNSNGVIQTSNTQFPSASGDSTKVLTGAGTWESRFKTVQVNATSTVDNADAAKTATIVSDDITHNNTLTIGVGNKWIRLAGDADADSFAISHMLSSLTASTIEPSSAAALETVQTDNELIIPWIKTDNAGHVIETGTYSYYVPHTFQNIAIATDSDATNEAESKSGTSTADNIVDTYTMGTANKWLRMAHTDDAMTIGHTLSPVINDTSLSQTDGLASDVSYTIGKQNNTTDDEKTYAFDVPYYTVDRAGHVIASSTQTVTLAHGTSGVTAGSYGLASSETIATLDSDNTFEVPYYTVNETGHITSTQTNTVTLPENFTVIKTTSTSTSTSEQATANADISASTLVDTLTFAAGNKWIHLASNATDKSLSFAHALTTIQAVSDGGDIANQTPSFGSTFQVPNFSTDNAGHVTSVSTHTVKIPQNDYSETQNKTAGVITTIALTKDTGKFDATRVNVGTLPLTEYVYDSTNTNKIVNTDTINGAFSKVDAQLAKEISDRENAITNLSNATNDSITSLNNSMTAMNDRLVASDNTIQGNLTQEIADRENGDRETLSAAKQYTEDKIASLVDSAPTTLDTLKELSDALGGDKNFATTVATNIGTNTAAISALETNKVDPHIANMNNPHDVSKSQVGLGNVTNESKETMFTNPVFTGVPVAPTAAASTSTTQIATTEFVQVAVNNAQTVFDTAISGEATARDEADAALVTAIEDEATARSNADTVLSQAIADEATARDEAIRAIAQAALNDLLANYGLTLNKPEFVVEQSEDTFTLTVTVNENMQDECTCIWYKKQVDADPIPVSEAVQMTAEETGDYYCVVTRTHNTHTSTAESAVYPIVIPEPEPEPDPTPEPEPEAPSEDLEV